MACNKASRHKVGNVKRLRKLEDGKSLGHGKAKGIKRNFVWENAEREETLRKARSGNRVSERSGKVRS